MRLLELGVLPGDLVALYAPRSMEMIVCLLGILKAGAAYVALDMESPPDRLGQMMSLIDPKIVITLHPLVRDLPTGRATVLFLNEECDLRAELPNGKRADAPHAAVGGADLAYVAFTSGSTGTPKGVRVTHRGVVSLATADDVLPVRREDVFLQFAPISFDASTFEIWTCLLNGAKLAIFPPWKPSLADLGGFIESRGITILWLSAGLFHQMVENQLHNLAHVRRLFTGGDVVSPAHAAAALQGLKNCRLVNGYGPTENTTFSCCHPILEVPPAGQSIPIGKPVAGTECWVLDEWLNPVEAEEAGELYLGGDGLADGYLGNRQLTLERFVPHPFSLTPGARLYRTGDKVRYLPDGNLEFLGRTDRQVKIMGYRVEPDEIEAALRRHPEVRDARVIVQRSIAGSEQVTVAVVPIGGLNVDAHELREFATNALPLHMVPSHFVFLDEFPLNANGKIDHEALEVRCADGLCDIARPREYNDPAIARLATIWTHVLGRPDIDPSANFFEMGGSSLRAAYLLARIQKEFKQRVRMDRFFIDPTISGLAAILSGESPQAPQTDALFKQGGAKPALFCLPGQGGEMFAYLNTVEHFSATRTIYGLQCPLPAEPEAATSIEEMAAIHVKTIQALQPEGPYHLFGFCFGGLLAFEAARQLRALHADVGLVGVLQFDIHDMPWAPYRWTKPTSLWHFLMNLPLAVMEFFKIPKNERNLVILRLLYRLLRLPGDSPKIEPQMTPEERLYAAHESAWRSYVPKAFRGVVTVLRPRRMPVLQPDPAFGWRSVKGQRVEIRSVPGPGLHGECLKRGEGVAAVIEAAIEQRERELVRVPANEPPLPATAFQV